MAQLTGAQRKYLRGLAHGLKPLARVGRDGLTAGVLGHLDAGLESHELVKVKLDADRQVRRQQTEVIGAELGCENVGTIGHIAIFYRPARDPEKRSVGLPGPAEG